MFDNTSANVDRWIHETSLLKPGVIMPRFGCGQTNASPYTGLRCISDTDIQSIVAYLESLR
jgi:hypothetical protein